MANAIGTPAVGPRTSDVQTFLDVAGVAGRQASAHQVVLKLRVYSLMALAHQILRPEIFEAAGLTGWLAGWQKVTASVGQPVLFFFRSMKMIENQ